MRTHAVAFKPLDDRIIVRRLEEKPTIILLTDREPNQMAEVLAVGPGAWDYEVGYRRALEVKIGDVVLIPGAANRFPDWQEGEQLLIREADVAGVLNFNGAN
jgi:co-chaperonin GroES (HSP10)